MAGNVEECKEACREKEWCTAFNYGGGRCTFRNCSLPVLDPCCPHYDYVGYNLKKGGLFNPLGTNSAKMFHCCFTVICFAIVLVFGT